MSVSLKTRLPFSKKIFLDFTAHTRSIFKLFTSINLRNGSFFKPYNKLAVRVLSGIEHSAIRRQFDRMMNEEVQRDVCVVQIRDKVQESRLRWYGHVRRCEDDEMIMYAADREKEGKGHEENRDKDRRTVSRKMEDRSIWSCAKAEQDGKQ